METGQVSVITDIGFMNRSIPDETVFDTHDETELALMWWDFCKENGIITYVEKRYKEALF